MGWALILLTSLVIRIAPLWGNNFYFTVDQGRDAVYVREILAHGTFFSKGPESTIRGIFTGPGWYYWLAPGYFLAQGHPVGGIISLIIVNLVVMGALMRMKGLKTGLVLLFFWPWYDATRYAFNPFLLVPLVIILGLLLERKKYGTGLLMVAMAVNAHLFGPVVMAATWLVVVVTKKFSWLMMVGLGLVVYAISPVQREWYVVFVWPVLLVAMAQKLNKWLVAGIVVLEICFFVPRYSDQWNNPDTSVLKNQLAVVDWVYKDKGKSGLYVYDYTDRFYDFPYQYLVWWKHPKTLPCEYANFPDSNKAIYVPGWDRYAIPQTGCDGKNRYLIIESQTNGETNSNWIWDFRATTKLVESVRIGKTVVEKRQTTPLFGELYYKGLNFREYRDNSLIIKIPDYWKMEKLERENLQFSNNDGSITGKAKIVGQECKVELVATGVMEKATKLLEEIGNCKLE